MNEKNITTKRKSTTISLPDDFVGSLKKRAKTLKMSVSEYLRHLIRKDLGLID